MEIPHIHSQECTRVAGWLITFTEYANGTFRVMCVNSIRFGFADFDSDQEHTARNCYANTIEAERKKLA